MYIAHRYTGTHHHAARVLCIISLPFTSDTCSIRPASCGRCSRHTFATFRLCRQHKYKCVGWYKMRTCKTTHTLGTIIQTNFSRHRGECERRAMHLWNDLVEIIPKPPFSLFASPSVGRNQLGKSTLGCVILYLVCHQVQQVYRNNGWIRVPLIKRKMLRTLLITKSTPTYGLCR